MALFKFGVEFLLVLVPQKYKGCEVERHHSIYASNATLFLANLPISVCLHMMTFFGVIFWGAAFLAPTLVWSQNDQSLDPGISVEAGQSESVGTFPLKVGGDFELIDHNGKLVTNETYKGRHMLVFFGYVNCKNMCSISLARIGKALELLGDSVNKLTPLVITVDPDRDTPEVMKSALNKFHPNFIGLTGKPDKLQAVYKNYKQKPTSIGNDWNNDPIISHSSYIYLMDKNGEFATLFPPALNPERMADIIRKYTSF